MNSHNPASKPVQPPVTTPVAARKKRPWLLYGLAAFGSVVVLVIATVFVTLWWLQRPLKPVVLTAAEKAVVEDKLQHLNTIPSDAPANPSTTNAIRIEERHYEPGSKVLTLTEREINGLLNANTDFGENIRLEFARNAINAYLAVPIPQDAPMFGGKMFRARGRFSLEMTRGEPARAVLEDVTVFGLSLPKAWLGGLKGENLLHQVVGETNSTTWFPGVKKLRIEPGALVIEVDE